MQKLSPHPTPLMGAQGYQRFPRAKPAVGQMNIALHAAPANLPNLGYAFPAQSASFPTDFSGPQRWNVY